jgi:hypothetical protein
MKNIVENNKLIAEFLGYSQPHPDYPNTTYWYKKDCQPLTILLFHSDWSWLMRVVEKIERLGYVFEIKITGCRINQIENGSIIVLRWEEDKTIILPFRICF